MNNLLKILEILTNPNLNEEDLRVNILKKEDNLDVKLAVLFRRFYGVFKLEDEFSTQPLEIISKIVQFKRRERFEKNKYWSIWKEEGFFFGFVEGFFHAQEGKNQLCKIRGQTIEEDILLTSNRKSEIKKKFGNISQLDYFKNPDIFVFRFRSLEEFRVFLRVNKIERMVGKREGMQKGMHFNIYVAICEIAKDEFLKEVFKNGVLNKDTGKIDAKFFDSKNCITKNGLYAILSSFKGYGPKISKMVMNLVFEVGIVAVDRRVLRSALVLKMVQLKEDYLEKIAKKFNLQNFDDIAYKTSSLSEKYALKTTEDILNRELYSSPFLLEADFLLFTYNGGEGWNFNKESFDDDVCKVGRCLLDEEGVCKLRKKFQYNYD
jgi:hypothetical protein